MSIDRNELLTDWIGRSGLIIEMAEELWLEGYRVLLDGEAPRVGIASDDGTDWVAEIVPICEDGADGQILPLADKWGAASGRPADELIRMPIYAEHCRAAGRAVTEDRLAQFGDADGNSDDWYWFEGTAAALTNEARDMLLRPKQGEAGTYDRSVAMTLLKAVLAPANRKDGGQ